jgi:two-component sensor histidine kinase
VCHQSGRAGIISLLHVSNGLKLIETLPLQNTQKFGQKLLNALYDQVCKVTDDVGEN